MARGVVEFDGPGLLHIPARGQDRAAAAVSSGPLGLDPAGGRVRGALRIRASQFLLAIMPVLALALTDVPVLGRLLFLVVTRSILCVNVYGARAAFERWVEEGARRA